jgi:hypothetical protein
MHHTLDLHPLPVLRASQHLGESDTGRGRNAYKQLKRPTAKR